MRTLLVPVDFTATSENAVNFAAEWCKKYGYEKIILLKTFYVSMFENMFVASEYSSINEDNINRQRDEELSQLREMCERLSKKTGESIRIQTEVIELPLLRGIFEIIQQENPELIVVGSDNYTYSSGSMISGSVISIAKASPIRVLVVPSHCTYQSVKEVLLPYNFRMLNDIDKITSLRTSPYWSDIKLHVLNIGTNKSAMKQPNRFSQAEDKYQNLLKNFEHQIYFTTENDVVNSISTFTEEHPVQLILALPGKHSFLYRLTHQSISEAIYRNASQPVLILK